MKVRFQADTDLNQIIVKATLRREPSIDFQTAHVANLHGLSDKEVLSRSAKEGRVLVTHDRKTMLKHFANFITSELSSGVLVVSQKLPASFVAEEIALIWTASEANAWENRIYSLPL